MAGISLLLNLLVAFFSANCVHLPEESLPTPELIKYWGYPVESHEAITTDGYYLTIHRIPYGRTNSSTNKTKVKPVMFLLHGLVSSSACYVINLPNESLGFMLADAGYDVWMGNVRGNIYSMKHANLSVKSSEFWDFSFDEMSKYDLPAMLDYVLKNTKQNQLYYVGHSQGAMMIFAGLSENVELQKKIKMAFALAPVSRIIKIYSPLRFMTHFETALKWVTKLLGIRQFLKPSKTRSRICPWVPYLCKLALFLTSGYDTKNLNATRMSVYNTHVPAGTSVKEILHFMQMVKSTDFRKYDYGTWQNVIRYNSTQPPNYRLENVHIPIVLFSGSADWVATPINVNWTAEHLPNVVHNIQIEGYNHFDFTSGISSGKDVYKRIIDMVRDDML